MPTTAPDPSTHGLSTRCVHAGEQLDSQGGIHAPLYNHSTFGFPSTAAILDVVEGRAEGNLYTRYGLNPTIRSLESRLANLEGGEAAWAFSSGMAAEAATFLAHASVGDNIVCIGDVYGGTFELLSDNLPTLGITTRFLLVDELDQLPVTIDDRTRIVFFETPTNPTLDVIDIPAVAQIARSAGALTVVDSTFATPVNQNPLALGADLVIHSATKYLGGHSDLTGGAVIGSAELLGPIWTWRKNLGQMIAPEVASLLSRSIRTLVVRVHTQNATTEAVAAFLDNHPKIIRVNHPSLSNHPGHVTAKSQMRGYGGMLSFVYDGDASVVVDRLRIFTIAASLGGVESLVTQPVTTTHHGMAPEQRARRGIVDGLVRLSIGLEDVEDLIADLDYALS